MWTAVKKNVKVIAQGDRPSNQPFSTLIKRVNSHVNGRKHGWLN
jgi:hypothetical protein